MKRTIVILSIVLTLGVAGVLYGKHSQSNNEETVSLKEAYTAQYSYQMPDVIMDPMVGFPVY